MELLYNFKDYLYDNEKSEKTVSSYISDIKQFFKFYSGKVSDIDKKVIRQYTAYLQSNFAIKTANRKLVSLHQFIEYLNEEEEMNISVKIKQLKVSNQNFIDVMIENSDVRRMVKAAEEKNDIRAVAIMYTLFYTGARVSELLQIKVDDVDRNSVYILGKGNKYRELLIPKKLKDVLNEYKTERNKGIHKCPNLFVGQRGPINRQTVHNMLKYYAGQAHFIDKTLVHAHSFRHLYAQNLAKLHVPPVVISQLLGHSLNVTGLYMQNSKKDLLKIINKMDIKDNF
ncbi:MAG: tyrosine-type recombinase/integrase [Inconstantimicrobium porci]|uniref:tyrosine-type recombinase/integrase n=1 Tax=Inconstantimicrobium porci TaxID=2652291 RepID=UPI0024094510|nr:tyrosine-type recombinase/integrase [Inconstantimicrobium porci]MDD6770908.1 tyrosine-type recombinase/integrase [Inconstantimicrobium porci]MDY5911369.1 tyrosine-type recombinase/integrase [Inconstantimicrobium porci]